MTYSLPADAQIWTNDTPVTSSPTAVDKEQRYALVFVSRRRPEVTKEQYVRHYTKVSSNAACQSRLHIKAHVPVFHRRQIHPTFSLRLPGLLYYRQSVLDDSNGPTGMMMDSYDSISEYHFATKEAYLAAMSSPQGQALDGDTVQFMYARPSLSSYFSA